MFHQEPLLAIGLACGCLLSGHVGPSQPDGGAFARVLERFQNAKPGIDSYRAYRAVQDASGSRPPADRAWLVARYFADRAVPVEGTTLLRTAAAAKLSPGVVLEALVTDPRLADPKLAAGADALWRYVECGPMPGSLNYPLYERYLKARLPDVPDAVVERLYRKGQANGLKTMMNVSVLDGAERKKLLWGIHCIESAVWRYRHRFLPDDVRDADAAEALEYFSSHREWWVRLYAATVVNYHAQYRALRLMERLQRDDHSLVRKLALEKNGRDGQPGPMSPSDLRLTPDEAVQEHLKRWQEAGSSLDALQALQRLVDLTRPDDKKLILQSLYYAVQHEELEIAAYAPIGGILVMNIPRDVVVDAIAPYAYANDKRIGGAVELVWHWLDAECEPLEPDFSTYDSYWRTHKGEGTDRVIERMYRRAPDRAVEVLGAVHAKSDAQFRETISRVRWSVHLVSQALWRYENGFITDEQMRDAVLGPLLDVGRAGEWWARLYVAAVLRGWPPLRNPVLVQALVHDPHPLVQRFAASMEGINR